jgi:hypothetical protein
MRRVRIVPRQLCLTLPTLALVVTGCTPPGTTDVGATLTTFVQDFLRQALAAFLT